MQSYSRCGKHVLAVLTDSALDWRVNPRDLLPYFGSDLDINTPLLELLNDALKHHILLRCMHHLGLLFNDQVTYTYIGLRILV